VHPNDPIYPQQWHLAKLGNIEKVWDEYNGAGIRVGIYDSGVQTGHPDLAPNYDPTLRVIIGGSPLDGEPNATTPDTHGTEVAGILCAGGNNNQGVIGVAWGASFASVPIVDPDGPVYLNSLDNTVTANLFAALHQMSSFDVANNSWNSTADYFGPYNGLHDPQSRTRFIELEFAHASEAGRGGLGTIVVQGVANNNWDAQGTGYNTSRYTITVAGTQEDGFAADFSNHGACVLITAPATEMVSTDLTGAAGLAPDDYFDAADNAALPSPGLHGTSLSGPQVSGVAALMLQTNPGLGWRDVQNILAASATHTGSAIGAVVPGTNEDSNWFVNDAADWNGGGMHFSNDYGYGGLNAYNAVRMAEAWSLFGSAQTSANEHSWSNWKWAGGNVNTGIPITGLGSTQDAVTLTTSPFAMRVEHVDVTIDFVHQDFTDLRVFLVSPEGTEVQLYDGTGGDDTTSDSEIKWTFGVDALRGELTSGDWHLRIDDVDAANSGQLYWFEVKVYGEGTTTDPSLRDDTYHYTDEFLAMAGLAGQSGRTTFSDAGGTDWIDAAAVTGNFALNLAAGAASSVNGAAWFTIAGGTSIENAVTGDGNDSLTGNTGANTLYGMRGTIRWTAAPAPIRCTAARATISMWSTAAATSPTRPAAAAPISSAPRCRSVSPISLMPRG
jgi:subtilisin-like proprotein convertase family protein